MTEFESDPGGSPPEENGPIPALLKFLYLILPLWGLIWFYFFCGGSHDTVLDGKAWRQLQQAAKTTWHIQ